MLIIVISSLLGAKRRIHGTRIGKRFRNLRIIARIDGLEKAKLPSVTVEAGLDNLTLEQLKGLAAGLSGNTALAGLNTQAVRTLNAKLTEQVNGKAQELKALRDGGSGAGLKNVLERFGSVADYEAALRFFTKLQNMAARPNEIGRAHV